MDAAPLPTPVPSPHRPRVLLIAEACNPEMASVPLEGYSHTSALRKLVDAHVVTSWYNAEALRNAGWEEGRDFTGIDTQLLARPAWQLGEWIGGRGKGWTTVAALSTATYYYFEHLLWRRFGRRVARGEFDLVHRVTPLSPTQPSLIAARCRAANVPFVIGPINGGLPWPPGFDDVRRQENEWLSYLRHAHRLLPCARATWRSASAILMGSRDQYRQVPRECLSRCFYVPENAIDPARFTVRRQRVAARPIHAIFVGRLVPYKGPDMLIEAAAPLIAAGELTLDVIGDGPMRGDLESLVASRGLGVGVRMHGWVQHRRVQESLAESDVFVFPSVREFGGAVALEAMAVGAVPIVLDYGGPAELVTPATGFLIPMGSRPQIVQRLRDTLAQVVADPPLIDRRSPAALRRAHEQFTWDRKAARTVDVYRWVLDPASRRPAYPMPEPDSATAPPAAPGV